LKKSRTVIQPLDLIVGVTFLLAVFYLVYRVKVGLHYRWEWEVIPQYLLRYDSEKGKWVTNILSQGFFTTIRLSIWSTFLALIIGTTMGLFRAGQSLFGSLLGRTYVEIIRNLPPLVLIFIFYYFISEPILNYFGIDAFISTRSKNTQDVFTFLFAPPDLFTRFLSALITLSIFEGAYIAEIVRAGVQSIDRGQWEAAAAIGLPRWQQMALIILPQTIKKILPPLAGQFISTIKDSAIVSVISIQELTFQGMELMASTYLTFEVWITITILYLFLTLSLSVAVGKLEGHMKRCGT
jgi:polar amino acid transport system permease protein